MIYQFECDEFGSATSEQLFAAKYLNKQFVISIDGWELAIISFPLCLSLSLWIEKEIGCGT